MVIYALLAKLTRNSINFKLHVLKLDIFGDEAIATFILDATFTTGDKTVKTKERSTLVFLKEDGAWRIVLEHFSPIQ